MKTNNKQIRKPFLPDKRGLMIDALSNNWEMIVNKSGSVLLTARQVLDVIQNEGLLDHAGEKLKGANSVGDLLGAKHYDLPFLSGIKRRYLLPAISWGADDRLAFDALTLAERSAHIKELEAKLLGPEQLAPCVQGSEVAGAEGKDQAVVMDPVPSTQESELANAVADDSDDDEDNNQEPEPLDHDESDGEESKPLDHDSE